MRKPGATLGIFGAGGLGREVNIIARKINNIDNRWEKIIYIDDDESITDVLGVPVYMFNKSLQLFPNLEVTIAIGEPSTREKVYNKVKDAGIGLATLIHPGVYVDESTRIGEGTTICNGVNLTSCIEIGDNVYVQPHAIIGHDVRIGRHSVVGGETHTSGNVKIGERVFIGFLAGILQGLSVGDDAEISAGSIVFRDIEPGMIVMGNPARVIGKNEGRGVFSRKSHDS